MTINEAIAHAKEQTDIFGGVHKKFLKIAIVALERMKPWIGVRKNNGY